MCKRIFKKYFLIFSLFIYECLISQTNNLYYHDDIGTIYSGENIIIKQLIFTQEPILNGMLFFRNKGEISYQETEMFFENGRWQGLIPSDRVTIQGIEYVTILTTVNGGRISMPLLNNPFDNPIDVIVLPRKSIDKDSKFLTRSGKSSIESDMIEADILILSPEDGSINRPDEIVISVSLFNAPNVDKNTFKVYIDGKDYTDEVTIFDDVLSLVPNDELGIGLHKIKILSKSTFGIDIVPIEWAFSATKGIKNISESFIYSGSFNGKVSRNTVSNIVNNEGQSSGKLNAELSWIKASFSFRQTDRESGFLQPLNRKSLTLKITDYFSFESGDVFPSISPYSIDGKRINGQYINAGFKFFDFHYASGQQIRAVQFREGTDKAYAISSDKISYLNNSNRIIKLDRRGYTFPRNIITSRLNISAFNLFKAGIHFYKAKDDFDEIDRKYEDFKIDEDSPIIKFALQSKLIAPITKYFGFTPLLSYVGTWYSPGKMTEHTSSQLFHCDQADVRQIKVFVHCSDITNNDGALNLINAHKSQDIRNKINYSWHPDSQMVSDIEIEKYIQKSDWVAQEGKEGTVAFADTSRCFHFGSRLNDNSKERLMMVFQFLSPCAFNLPANISSKIPFSKFEPSKFNKVEKQILGIEA